MNHFKSALRIDSAALKWLALLILWTPTCFLFAQESLPEHQTKSNKLIYISQENVPAFRKSEHSPVKYASVVDSVKRDADDSLTASDSLNPRTTLNVRTRPTGAEIFIDSVFAGTSPVLMKEIAPGPHKVRCTLRNFRELSAEYDIEPGIEQTLIMTFVPDFGVLSLTTEPDGALVTIDSTHQTYSPVQDVQLPVGPHTVSISHPLYGEPINGSVLIYPGYRSTIEAGEKHFNGTTLTWSIVLPGLGQIVDGSYLKGSLEMLSALGSAYYVYDSFSHRDEKQSAFELAKTKYAIASNETEAMLARTNMDLAASDLDKANNRVTTSWVLLGTSYVVSLVDALLFHSYRRELVVIKNVRMTYPDLMEYHRNGNIRLGVNVDF